MACAGGADILEGQEESRRMRDMDGINQSAYMNAIASEYQNTKSYGTKDEKVKKQSSSAAEKLNDVSGRTIGEPKLSDKALKYYEQLKKKFSNMEFVLVSPEKKAEAERNKGMYASSNKLVVLIDSDKIEKMAEDEAFRKKYEAILTNATPQMQMLKQRLGASGNKVSAFGMTFDDYGNASLFAVVDKSLAQQRERIEAKREANIKTRKQEAKKAEKKRTEKKAEEKRAETRKEAKEAERLDDGNKVTVTAKTWDELIRKIDDVLMSDMADSMFTAAERNVGQNFDFTL